MRDNSTFDHLRHWELEQCVTIRPENLLDHLVGDAFHETLSKMTFGDLNPSFVQLHYVSKGIELVPTQALDPRLEEMDDRLNCKCQQVRHLYLPEPLVPWNVNAQAVEKCYPALNARICFPLNTEFQDSKHKGKPVCCFPRETRQKNWKRGNCFLQMNGLTFLCWRSARSTSARIRVFSRPTENRTDVFWAFSWFRQIVVTSIVIDSVPDLAFSCSVTSQVLELFVSVLTKQLGCFMWKICLGQCD